MAALRGYLFNEVDRTLADMVQSRTNPDPTPPRDDDIGPPRPGPVGRDVMYVRISDAAGATHEISAQSETVTDASGPARPDRGRGRMALSAAAYVVDSESGDTRWRVMSAPLADGSGTVTVAQDIGGIDATVNRLIVIELAIGALVLLMLGITGRILIRRSLRPLGVVEETAAAIAAGDLARRAPASDPRTEVGSLAHSFNTMVDDLAGALAAQQASEQAARDSAGRAQASEARMRQFVADAGHELRTPLTSVRGFAELYRIGAVDHGPALDDAMSRIEAEAARMGVLVDDLLLLARLDQQRPLEITDVDLVDLVTDAVTAARAAAPDREVAVLVSDPAVGLSVPGDPLRLRQVVDNLLANALQVLPHRTTGGHPHRRSRGRPTAAGMRDAGGGRSRSWDASRGGRAGVRAVLPRGRRPLPGRRRIRARPVHCRGHRRRTPGPRGPDHSRGSGMPDHRVPAAHSRRDGHEQTGDAAPPHRG